MSHNYLLLLFIVTFVSVFPVKSGSVCESPIITDSVSMQAPDDIIEKMTTEELLQSCVSFPYVIDCIIRRGEFPGLDLLSEKYNGYAELFRRDDFVNVLLGEYHSLPNKIAKTPGAIDTEKGLSSFRYLIYEYLMAEDVFTEKIKRSSNKADLEPMILDGVEAIVKHPELFSGIHSKPLIKLMDSGVFSDADRSRMTSLLYANGYYESTVIHTPNGSPIENVFRWNGSDFSPREIREEQSGNRFFMPQQTKINIEYGKIN